MEKGLRDDLLKPGSAEYPQSGPEGEDVSFARVIHPPGQEKNSNCSF